MHHEITLTINGDLYTVAVQSHHTLLKVLREQLGITEETPESLRQIYAASLALLYKLLFLLYAEARGLLPMANPAYREESLTTFAKWAADRLDNGRPISDATHATAKYNALLTLFRRIDLGDPALDIPRYDGGMSNPGAPDNQFLEAHRLSDRALAKAVVLPSEQARSTGIPTTRPSPNPL